MHKSLIFDWDKIYNSVPISVDFFLKNLKGYKTHEDINLHPYYLLIEAFEYC